MPRHDSLPLWLRWAVEQGLDERLTKSRSFRFSRDALFNWPNEISAYINIMSLRLLGGSDRYYLTRGTYGETLIAPIIRHFEKLGGRVVPYHKLVGFRHEQGRVTRLDFAVPDPQYHDQGRKKWDCKVRVLDHLIELKDFDQVVFAMPVDNFRELNRDDEAFWISFPGSRQLHCALLSLQGCGESQW